MTEKTSNNTTPHDHVYPVPHVFAEGESCRRLYPCYLCPTLCNRYIEIVTQSANGRPVNIAPFVPQMQAKNHKKLMRMV
jgi:hypothetical protein